MYVHVPPLCGFMNHVCHATRYMLMYAGVCSNMGAYAHVHVFTVPMEHKSVCPVLLHACIHAYLCINMCVCLCIYVPDHICTCMLGLCGPTPVQLFSKPLCKRFNKKHLRSLGALVSQECPLTVGRELETNFICAFLFSIAQ